MQNFHLLYLCKWYPNKKDIQNGNFLKKQAELLSTKIKVSAIFLMALSEQQKTEIVVSDNQNLLEIIIYYKSYKNPILKFYFFLKYWLAAFKMAEEKLGTANAIQINILPQLIVPAYFHSLKRKIPIFVSEHWSGFINGNFKNLNLLQKLLYNFGFKRAKKVFVVSETLKKGISNFYSINSKIKVIPNIIQVSEINQKHQFDKKNPKILFVADLVDDVKNVSGLIKTLADFNHKNFNLTIVGDGKDRKKIKVLIEKLNLNNQIKMLGSLSSNDVLKLYHLCDFVVINSFFETFSMVAAEAIAHGKPVICTKCGGPEEFINEENGILIPINDKNALQLALNEMIENYSRFNPLKIGEEIKAKFDSEKTINQLTNYIKS